MAESSMFTWVQTHKEIVQYLKKMKGSQEDLISALEKAGVENFTDRDASGMSFKLNEMEPFTFFFYIYKYGESKRLQVLQNIASHLGLSIPSDTFGVPSANAVSVRIFPQKDIRTHDEINRLWALFDKAIEHKVTDEDFQDALRIVSVGKAKLTEAFFMVDPEFYLCIDGQTVPYLSKILGIDPIFNTYSEYMQLLIEVKSKTNIPFPELSFEAWKWNTTSNKPNYWVFQCNPSYYDIKGALNTGRPIKWRVMAHKDKIQIGDKVILWVSGSESGCYALANVTSEVEQTTSDNWEQVFFKTKDASLNLPENMVEVTITHNLAHRPILKSHLAGIKELADLKAGIQGTNFVATEKQYRAMEKLASGSNIGDKRYWLFSPGRDAEKWEEFYTEGYMAMGWKHLGDLNQYNSQEEIADRLQELSEQDVIKKTNDAKSNWQFKTEMKPGDIVIIKQDRSMLLGYGEISSDYYFDPSLDNYQKCRKVDWLRKGEWQIGQSLVMKTLTDITEYPSDHPDFDYYYQMLMAAMEADDLTSKELTDRYYPKLLNSHPLNLILYGPPGTGKTYSSVNKAVEIADPDFMRTVRKRAQIKKRYGELVAEGKIVFATFHQSMSYEDFIEGIKPVTKSSDHGNIAYEVVPGIFKRICLIAGQPVVKKVPKPISLPVRSKVKIDQEQFSRLFDVYLRKLPIDSVTSRSSVVLSTVSNYPFEVFRNPGRHSIIVRSGEMRTPSVISKIELTNVLFNEKRPALQSYEQILIDEIIKLDEGSSAIISQENSIEQARAEVSFQEAYSLLSKDLETISEKVMKIKTPKGTEFGISLNGNGNLTVHTGPDFKPSVTLTKENLFAHASGGEVPPYDKGYFIGVLKLMTDKYGLILSIDRDHSDEEASGDTFDIAYAALIKEIKAKLSRKEKYILYTKLSSICEVIQVLPDNTMRLRNPDNKTYGIDVEVLRKLFYSSEDPYTTNIKKVDVMTGRWHSPEYRALWQKLVQLSKNANAASSDVSIPNKEVNDISATDNDLVSTHEPYVLIIDEINRGNVSQIFGELITLIEQDKRAGMPEALETILPYSKENFSVPSNLYIIGTMNTADRSVEAIDTALRRRFSFCEMTPDYNLLVGNEINGIDLGNLLLTINQRIEGLLDKDHSIGHSYFLRIVKGESTLKDVFYNEIIPLLQEYFYGNFGRIELVLGRGFVKSIPVNQSIFANPSPDNDEFSEHVRYTLIRHEEMDDASFQKALRVLMKESNEA